MATTLERFSYESPVDALEIRALLALPEREPIGVVQLAHGMAEHKERYIPLMEYLAGHGYACAIADHRGHGESVRAQDDLGHMGKGGASALVADMRALSGLLRARFPGRPLFLFGHSMGAMASQLYLRGGDADLTGLILCGISANNPAAVPGLALARLLSVIRGERHRSKFMDRLMFGNFTSHIPGAKSGFAWLNSDEPEVRKYEDDPLCGYLFTLNGYIGLISLMRRAYAKSGWRVAGESFPILMISGADDPCIGCSAETFQGCAAFLGERGYANVASKLYPGMRHEILNEPGRQQVYEDVLAFLERHTPRPVG